MNLQSGLSKLEEMKAACKKASPARERLTSLFDADTFVELDTFLADNENGEWYGYLHYDGTAANTLKGNIFKGPFHLPRMLMLIDKIEKGLPLV